MTPNMRYGNKWNTNELLALQREYELLEWSIQEIAEKHKRSVNAILFKLESEGYINTWYEARGFELVNQTHDVEQDEDTEVSETDSDSDSESETDSVTENIVLDVIDNDSSDNIHSNEEVNELSERVWKLETNVSEISSLVKKMIEVMVSKKTAKRGPLRKY